MAEGVYILRSADRRNLSLVPDDLDYFQSHFVGESMAEHWQPPPVVVSGKTLRLRDFVSWMLQAPVLSTRARISLEDLIGCYVEFLPLVELRGMSYFAINIVKLLDCLDRAKSDIIFSPSRPGQILGVNSYQFLSERLEAVPIFKIPDDPSAVFVTRPFIDAVIQCRLTGAKFADPSVSPWVAAAQGESCNIVPGVLD